MWYKLNDMFGMILLFALVGGGAIYGLILFIEMPPVIRQESDGPSAAEIQARKELEKQMKQLQDQQTEAFRDAEDVRRRALGLDD
jgi:hypothetical protein